MALTYSTYGSTLVAMMAGRSDDANYVTVLPSIIDYAEGRIYRDLDLLSAVVRDSTASLSTDNRNFTLPTPATGRFTIVSGINLMSAGVRVAQLEPVSLEFLDAAWPSESGAVGVLPQYFAMLTDQTIVVAPSPKTAYTVEVIGHIRPTALSAANTTTFLTTYMPELFLAASMIFASAYQKNFGAQADDPKMAVSWESQYQTLVAVADREEARKKWASASWTSKRVEPTAVPQRG
jgi:hypothetical protein